MLGQHGGMAPHEGNGRGAGGPDGAGVQRDAGGAKVRANCFRFPLPLLAGLQLVALVGLVGVLVAGLFFVLVLVVGLVGFGVALLKLLPTRRLARREQGTLVVRHLDGSVDVRLPAEPQARKVGPWTAVVAEGGTDLWFPSRTAESLRLSPRR